MKIIGVDNYARESVADTLVCENVGVYHGEKIVDFLNSRYSDTFYKLVEDDYRLWRGMEDLI